MIVAFDAWQEASKAASCRRDSAPHAAQFTGPVRYALPVLRGYGHGLRADAAVPVPRGSQVTRSKRCLSLSGRTNHSLGSRSTPESPGPPGMNTRVPIRC